jgi:hypothetical protein
MYYIKINNTLIPIDAVEFLTVKNGQYTPVEEGLADGFKAFTYTYTSPSEAETHTEIYAFPGHSLLGGEPVAELVADDEIDDNELLEMLDAIM